MSFWILALEGANGTTIIFLKALLKSKSEKKKYGEKHIRVIQIQ
jgi:hypothetical protein